jgi:membrane fusion protein (multidrug efflux system)
LTNDNNRWLLTPDFLIYKLTLKMKECLMIRLTTAALFLLLSMNVILQGCGREQTFSKKDSAIPVTLSTVTSMDVQHTIDQVGTLEANETVMVKSEAQGKIQKILFEEGKQVIEGKLLVKLDDAKIKAEIESIKSRIVQYRAELVNTKRNVLRNEDLLKDGVVNQKIYDDIITKRQVGEALLSEAQANLLLAQEQLKDTSITSPFQGFTSERFVSVGDFIGVGDPIVKIVQTDPLKLAFRIPEKYVPSITTGKQVEVTVDAFPGETFSGSIYFVSPDIDTATRTLLVKATVPNRENHLSPGMFAHVTVTVESHPNALVVPWNTLVVKEDETYVFRVDTGKVQKVPVKIMLVFDGKAEVEGNLSPGNTVVREGKFSIRDGDTVKQIDQATAAQ